MAWSGKLPPSVTANGTAGSASSSIARNVQAASTSARSNSSGAPPATATSSAQAQASPEQYERTDYEEDPFIIALQLDEHLQDHLTGLRDQYFPRRLNHLQGHITLFHALPASHLPKIVSTLSHLTGAPTPKDPDTGVSDISPYKTFPVKLGKPLLRGSDQRKAVFIPLYSKELYALHEDLLYAFDDLHHIPLTNQDKNAKFWPHATIVNKVKPERAEAVYEEVSNRKDLQSPRVNNGKAIGLELYWYRGGPWEHYRTFEFQ